MKTKKIGIVLEDRDSNRILGHLAKVNVSIELDEFWRPVVKTEIEEINFKYLNKRRILSVLTGTIDDAYELVEEFKKVGYNPLKFYFEGKEYKCSAN